MDGMRREFNAKIWWISGEEKLQRAPDIEKEVGNYMNIFKTERPIIAVILGVLLILKLMSALGFVFQAKGFVGPLVGFQMILIAFVAYNINTKTGGQSSLLTMLSCLVIVMILDGVVIYHSLNGFTLPSAAIPRIIGAELPYILTIAYIFFSKKLRSYKGIGA